jgi:Fe-S-cluster containining protein
MKDSLTLYKELLNTIDLHFEKVKQLQKDEMSCSKGCSSCCINDLTVCSIEAHYMKTAITNKNFNMPNTDETNCIFLIDNECSIYNHRPVVCRTQGLPLLYEGHEGEKELSVCEKNFLNNISSESILDMEKINTALIMINKMFENEQQTSIDSSIKRFTFKEITIS